MRIVLIGIFWFVLNLFVIWVPAWWLWNQLISPQLGLPSLNFLQSTGLLIYAWLVAHGPAKFKIEFGGDS